MNKGMVFHIKIGIWLLMVALCMNGCRHRGEVDDRLDVADSLMEIHPDSALIVLDEIDQSLLKGDARRARFALLKSMALDKNYIDTTTFDVLQPAIDYYLKKGTPDEMMKTLYYQGRVYENVGHDDLAMQSYLDGLDQTDGISDSLTLARIYVAQGALYYKQYLTDRLVDNNLKAAQIFGLLRKPSQQFKCNLRALYGAIVLRDKAKADSILSICNKNIENSQGINKEFLRSALLHNVYFGNDKEIRDVIEEIQKAGIAESMEMNLANAYTKIEEPEKALFYLNNAKLASDNILDSLTYWSVKSEIMENLGRNIEALYCHKNYSRLLEDYHMQLFSNELLFSEKKHEMEIENMAKIQKKDNLIKWILGGIAVLICIIGLVFYRYRMNKAARLLAESNAEKLRVEGEAQRLISEKLEAEGEQLRLESENLNLQIGQLEDEREKLSALLDKQETLSEDARELIRERISMLNGLFAQALTNQDSYGKEFKKYIAKIKKNKDVFQDSIVKVFEATHPAFMEYLKAHDLTEREVKYVCLYAIGLRGKEIGSYLDLARHYSISSDVRRKLGLGPNAENLGPFIRGMMSKDK